MSAGITDTRPHGIRTESDGIPDVERSREKIERREVNPATHVAIPPAAFAVLAKHVQHRLTLTTPSSLRCVDCTHTIDLTARPSTARSTSTSSIPNLHDPDGCGSHPGERVGVCGPCRSELIAAQGPILPRAVGVPMPAGFRATVGGAG